MRRKGLGWRELSKLLTFKDIERAVTKSFPIKELGKGIESTAKRTGKGIKSVAKDYYKAYFLRKRKRG